MSQNKKRVLNEDDALLAAVDANTRTIHEISSALNDLSEQLVRIGMPDRDDSDIIAALKQNTKAADGIRVALRNMSWRLRMKQEKKAKK